MLVRSLLLIFMLSMPAALLGMQLKNPPALKERAARVVLKNFSGINALPIDEGLKEYLQVQKLLQECKNDVQEALFNAAQRGNARAIQDLIALGAQVNMPDRFFGSTVLMCAVLNRRIESVRMLLAYDADIDTLSRTTGRTALMYAVCSGNIEMVKELLAKGAQVNKRSRYGTSALHLANFYSLTEIAQLLKEHQDLQEKSAKKLKTK